MTEEQKKIRDTQNDLIREAKMARFERLASEDHSDRANWLSRNPPKDAWYR